MTFEKYYGKSFKFVLKLVNPIKKKIITTECQVHKFINNQAVKILLKHDHKDEFNLFTYYLKHINDGAVWADQDFKSINHFYNPYKRKGLFGHENSLILTNRYYNKALKYWGKDNEKAMFYLGAAIHIVQDLTIPQHANVKLLDSHKQFETYVKYTFNHLMEYRTFEKPIRLNKPHQYVRFNARIALKVYAKNKHLKNNDTKFHKITLCSLPLAQRTTAGLLLNFYDEIKIVQ